MKKNTKEQMVETSVVKVADILNTEIAKILNKYNTGWFKDESLVEYSEMTTEDVDTYNNLFDARDLMEKTSRLF